MDGHKSICKVVFFFFCYIIVIVFNLKTQRYVMLEYAEHLKGPNGTHVKGPVGNN